MITFLDVTKGSPNFTLHMPFRTTTSFGIGTDVSAQNFLLFMGQTSPTPGGTYDTGNLSSPTLAVDQAGNGTLNSINLFWNRPDATMEICDVAVAVLS
jgi:hypothetical protein